MRRDGQAVALLLWSLAAAGGCDRETATGEPRATRATAAATGGRPGLGLKRKKGAPIEIIELTARPTINVLSGVDHVKFPGDVAETYNGLEVHFTVVARGKIASGDRLRVRHVCQRGDEVTVSLDTPALSRAGTSDSVALHRLKKKQRARGTSTSRPTAPELGKASACEVTFLLGERALGTVCARGGTRLARKPCRDDELSRPKMGGENAVLVSEPVARVAHEGVAGWYLLTANQRFDGDLVAWTRLTCREGREQHTRVFNHEEAVGHLDIGESVMLSFGVSKLRWLTREKGRCEVTVGLGEHNTAALATYCIEAGRSHKRACAR